MNGKTEKDLNDQAGKTCGRTGVFFMVLIMQIIVATFGFSFYMMHDIYQLWSERIVNIEQSYKEVIDVQQVLIGEMKRLKEENSLLKLENKELQSRFQFVELRYEQQQRTTSDEDDGVGVIPSGKNYTNINSESLYAKQFLNAKIQSQRRLTSSNPGVGWTDMKKNLADDLQKILNQFKESIFSMQCNGEDKTSNVHGNGAVYTRWGRKTCPPTATLVYHGVAGGSHYSHGGGVEKLCLPHDPQWGEYKDGLQHGSYIYGAEYQSTSLNDQDVPCAVCYTDSRSSQLMIPAWKTCPATWTKEYSGYLMAQHHKHAGSSFDCVDEASEADYGGQRNENGALFYKVEAVCGSLPCPKYVQGRELTCVVCTK